MECIKQGNTLQQQSKILVKIKIINMTIIRSR